MNWTPESNLKVLYYDELGFEHRGTIALTQPCLAPDVEDPDEEGMVCYLYIVDDRDEFNDKTYVDENGKVLKYANIRRSDECISVYDGRDFE